MAKGDKQSRSVQALTARMGHRWERLKLHLTARVHQAPVIVLGNQKSGTSAVAGLLATATGLTVTLDFPCWTYREAYLGAESIDTFVKRNRVAFSRQIVKEPSLTLLYEPLRSHFPKAQFVLVVRDPRDNIRSTLDRLGIRGDLPSLDPVVLSTLPPGWDWNIDCRWAGIEGDHYIDWMAERWNRFADVALQHPDSVHLVRYEDFVQDKSGAIGALAEDLSLKAIHPLGTNANKPFQPPGPNRGVEWQTFFGPENLNRILTRCHRRMQQLDYRT